MVYSRNRKKQSKNEAQSGRRDEKAKLWLKGGRGQVILALKVMGRILALSSVLPATESFFFFFQKAQPQSFFNQMKICCFSAMYKNICKLKKIKVHKVENKSPSKIHFLKAQPFNSLTFKCLVFAFNVYMTKMRSFYTCCFFPLNNIS